MRVISGSARGRALKAVPGISTRPTTDKVKEAVFSMIGPYFDGGLVLDLFAGTGGLGIEALSRGAKNGIFIDIEKKSIDTVLHNLEVSGFKEQAEVYRNDAGRALKLLAKRGLHFDLVFLDPPYKMKLITELITSMEEQALLKPNVRIIVEHDAQDVLAESVGSLQLKKRSQYGDTVITIYERIEERILRS
jgi:16S rRNA (guanine966-N2)-methyltransferase